MQVYSGMVVSAFLKAGVPLNKIESFRELLEENASHFTDRWNMYDYVPFKRYLSVIFDGTSRLLLLFYVMLIAGRYNSG